MFSTSRHRQTSSCTNHGETTTWLCAHACIHVLKTQVSVTLEGLGGSHCQRSHRHGVHSHWQHGCHNQSVSIHVVMSSNIQLSHKPPHDAVYRQRCSEVHLAV